jgi:hypothetical protein
MPGTYTQPFNKAMEDTVRDFRAGEIHQSETMDTNTTLDVFDMYNRGNQTFADNTTLDVYDLNVRNSAVYERDDPWTLTNFAAIVLTMDTEKVLDTGTTLSPTPSTVITKSAYGAGVKFTNTSDHAVILNVNVRIVWPPTALDAGTRQIFIKTDDTDIYPVGEIYVNDRVGFAGIFEQEASDNVTFVLTAGSYFYVEAMSTSTVSPVTIDAGSVVITILVVA